MTGKNILLIVEIGFALFILPKAAKKRRKRRHAPREGENTEQ